MIRKFFIRKFTVLVIQFIIEKICAIVQIDRQVVYRDLLRNVKDDVGDDSEFTIPVEETKSESHVA